LPRMKCIFCINDGYSILLAVVLPFLGEEGPFKGHEVQWSSLSTPINGRRISF
jgi:hypothetical protein